MIFDKMFVYNYIMIGVLIGVVCLWWLYETDEVDIQLIIVIMVVSIWLPFVSIIALIKDIIKVTNILNKTFSKEKDISKRR